MIKMREYIDDPILMLLVIQYLKDTKLTRFHLRETLKQCGEMNYRALENMINLSKHQDKCLELIQYIF